MTDPASTRTLARRATRKLGGDPVVASDLGVSTCARPPTASKSSPTSVRWASISVVLVGWILCCFAVAEPAAAVVAFSGTGQDFFEDPAATFPTAQPGLAGTSLDFSAAVDNEVLAVFPLATAGSFPGSAPIVITYTLGLTRLSDDFDPVFLASDGATVVGGQVGDNPNGSARLIAGTLSDSLVTVSEDPLIFQNAGFPAIGESVDAVIEIVLGDTSSEVTVSFLEGEAISDSSQVLDRGADLSFLLVANSAVTTGELYRLDSATLEIVPEPTGAAGFAVGIAALAAVGARRSRRTPQRLS